MCCNPLGPGGGGSVTLAPLKNTLWVDAQSAAAAGPGLPLTNGTQSAFATLVAAVAAFDTTDTTAGRWFVVQGDYTNAGTAIDFSAAGAFSVSIEGVGGDALQNDAAALPPLLNSANPGSGTFYLRNVTVAPTEGGEALRFMQSVFSERCFFLGSINVAGAVVETQCLHQGGVIAGQSSFTLCDVTQAFQFSTPLSQVDFASFMNFGHRGVTRTDGANDADWLLSTGPASQQRYAALQDANRTVNAIAWDTSGVWCSQASLTANRVLTVDMTLAPALALFQAYNFGGQGGSTLTVNGTVVADGTHVTFQNQAGVLTPIALEILS